MGNSKWCLQPGASERIINLWRHDKLKENGFRLLEVARCGKVNIWGKFNGW